MGMKGGFSMSEQVHPGKRPLVCGLLAHVDSGKTTLSEALLYTAGVRRTLGRVDHGDAYLDTYDLERERGITIFSKTARLETQNRAVTLVDTPGHVDFSAETERALPILDCALLLISGTDGVQAHTLTLWRLLERYHVPTFLFVNKMDLPGTQRQALLADLQKRLSPGCVDFGADREEILENAAMCDEALLESYVSGGRVTAGNLRQLIAERRLFPCLFGSALKLTGIESLLSLLDILAPYPAEAPEFAARVYKISRDAAGNRLTWLRLTGGACPVRQSVAYKNRKGEAREEKIAQIRLYSGEKFTQAERLTRGELAAVTGLTETYVGQGLGADPGAEAPVTEPVMTYRVNLPRGTDPAVAAPKLRQLEEEDPQLHLVFDGGSVHVQIMGKVQLDVFRFEVRRRFGMEITLDEPRIFYKETIAAPVEGVGHYEPLRHYAEVHILLEPLPPGSGLVFDTLCSPDVLDGNYQNLILTHMAEKIHRGMLTGSPIADMKLTLLIGKAHVKHTEGGDFRQATYRAIRQGLRKAQSVLLEPWYAVTATVPGESVGRVMTDIRAMGGSFDPPASNGDIATVTGLIPAAELGDYPEQLAAFTQGRGNLQLTLHGYAPCHNTAQVVEAMGYDPDADTENSADSIFCAHGAGILVKWDQVEAYMHLDSGYGRDTSAAVIDRPPVDDRELLKILEREFGDSRPRYTPPREKPAQAEVTIRPPRQRCLIVDGYNFLFAKPELAEMAAQDLDAARQRVLDALASYAGFTQQPMIAVFDGYRRRGNPGERAQEGELRVVYTREGETADRYIEELAAEIGKNYAVYVVSSDALVQLSSFRSGVLRMSSRELWERLESSRQEMQNFYKDEDRRQNHG